MNTKFGTKGYFTNFLKVYFRNLSIIEKFFLTKSNIYYSELYLLFRNLQNSFKNNIITYGGLNKTIEAFTKYLYHSDTSKYILYFHIVQLIFLNNNAFYNILWILIAKFMADYYCNNILSFLITSSKKKFYKTLEFISFFSLNPFIKKFHQIRHFIPKANNHYNNFHLYEAKLLLTNITKMYYAIYACSKIECCNNKSIKEFSKNKWTILARNLVYFFFFHSLVDSMKRFNCKSKLFELFFIIYNKKNLYYEEILIIIISFTKRLILFMKNMPQHLFMMLFKLNVVNLFSLNLGFFFSKTYC
uniref:Uncharacterized protein n=1 Tax=Amorphochlora amoebiformis TaxID=1561963 RepID=A0A0H5BLF8_9EUKA|nr:hypothetical protein [Amorphochlora amoebiformis]